MSLFIIRHLFSELSSMMSSNCWNVSVRKVSLAVLNSLILPAITSLSYKDKSSSCSRIRFDRFNVMVFDAAYSQLAFSTGFAMPRPPNLTGKDIIFRSVSETFLPRRAGIKVFLMHSSSGVNRSAVLGKVR